MFFRMLRHDLREKKGLNVILFLFMIAASVLVFISAAQIYSSFTGYARTREACKIADGALIANNGAGNRQSQRETVTGYLDSYENVADYVLQERVSLKAAGMDFAHFEESESESFLKKTYYLMPQPKDVNLAYDTSDQPFYLKNGQIAVPQNIQILTGAKTGERLRITTDLGNIFEFEIAVFYKRTDNWNRFLITQADFEALYPEFPVRTDIYQITLKNAAERDMQTLYMDATQDNVLAMGMTYYGGASSEEMFSSIIAVLMIFVSIFMILLIFMTIRFTMIAALKDEEKGIGMMRAVGVDSFGFRWLFAAKYIAFAAAGGIIGSVIGFPLSKRVILEYSPNLLSPPDAMLLLIGTAAVLVIIAVMILFSLSVMKRIRRTSVMNAIRGENRGERFGKTSALKLFNRNKMPVPLYLALSDILTRLKRYLFLIISYTLGAGIMLMAVCLRCSVVSTNYLRYDMITNMDFYLNLSKTQMRPYNDKTNYDGIPFYVQINEELKEAGIPADAELYYGNYDYVLHFGEAEVGNCEMVYGLPDPALLKYREGRSPEAADECAVSCYSADLYGITVGSVIRIVPGAFETWEGSPYKEHTLKVVGLVNYMEAGYPLLVMSDAYVPDVEEPYPAWWASMNIRSEDKDAVFRQLQEHFGAEHVQTPAEFMDYYLGEYGTILTLAMNSISAVVVVVLALITVLYLNIFLAEDKPEIALLKAVGFSDGAIAASQLLRMLLLTLFSLAAAIVLTKTAGLALCRLMIGMYVGLTGFTFEPMILFTFVWMPLILLAVVLIPTLLRLRGIRSMDIRGISEE